MAIKIPIGANASEAVREARKAGDAIEGIGDSLDVLARESARSSREAARSFDDIPDGVKDAARDVDRESRKIGDNLSDGVDKGSDEAKDSIQSLEKTFKQSVREMQRTDGKGGIGQGLADDTRRGTHEASESVKTFSDESKANLSEVASSFSGDLTSATDLIQGTLGGVVQDLGPIGLAAGAAGAVGVGLIGAAIGKAQEKQEALKAKTAELAQSMIESGREGAVGYDVVSDKLKELATEQDDLGVDLRSLKQIAKDAHQPFDDLAQAYAGNTDKIDELVQKYRDQQAELIKTNHAEGEAATSYEGANSKRINTLAKYGEKLTEVADTAKAASDEQRLYLESGAADLAANATAQQSYADSVVSAYAEAGDAQQGFTDDGVFNLDRYITKTAEAVKTIEDYSSNMATAVGQLGKSGHDEAIRYLESLGPDAAPLVQAFINAPEDQRGRLASLWDSLGGTASAKFGSGLQAGLNATPAYKTVTVGADLAQFNRNMAEATRQREVHIKVYEDNQGGRRQGMGVP